MIRHGLVAAGALALLLVAAVLTVPRWLGPAVTALLPPGWQLDELALTGGGAHLPAIVRLALSADGCRMLALEDGRIRLRWDETLPRPDTVEIAALSLDPACLPAAPASAGSSVQLPDWLGAVLGGTRLVVDRLTVAGWLAEPHRVELAAATAGLRVAADGPVLTLDGEWNPATGEGGFRASLPQAGPVTGLGLQGTVKAGLDLAAGIDLSARLEGVLPATRSKLDGELAGRWQPDRVTLDTLRLGLDQLTTPAFTALRPRLELEAPARLDPGSLQLTAAARIRAERLNITDAGRLDEPAITLRLSGDPATLDWSAEGRAGGGLGPIAAEGQWSETGLEGRLTLDRQALSALKPALPPTLPVELKGGTATADLALAWPRDGTDLALEGELKVADARLGGTHWAADRVAVRLPFRYAGGTWQLGGRRAAQLTVGTITAAVPAESLSARVAGAWPWSSRAPLRVEGLRLRLLGGEAALDTLRLPQRGRAVNLRLRGIQLEQVSALHGEEVVSLGGAVDADLPLHLDHGSLLIEDGTVRNATPVRLRLTDADAITAFKTNNPTLAQAADWLSDLHVDHLDGTVNLKRDGALILVATIEGRNPQRGDRPVRLNYRHEENLLHLLQSLRIGSDLSRGIEQRLSPQQRRR
jgi:hypothetical protein